MTTLIKMEVKMEERDQYHDNLMVYQIEIEEAMAHWNGEEYEPPWGRKEWNSDENFMTVLKSIESDYIVDIVSTLWFRGFSLIESLVNKCDNDKPESTSVQLIREIFDIDFTISALVKKYSGKEPLDRWQPFLGKAALSSYSIQKLELLHENGNLPDSTIVSIVQSTDKNNDHWGKVIFSLVEKVLNRIKNKKSIAMGLSRAVNRLEMSALVTEQIGDYYDKLLRKAKITQKGGKTSGSTKTSKKDLSGGKKTKHRPTTMKQYCTWVQEWNLLLKDKVEYHQTFKVIAEKFNKSPKTIKNVIEDSQLKAKIEEFAMENNIDLKNK